jgi:hypothetical protein
MTPMMVATQRGRGSKEPQSVRRDAGRLVALGSWSCGERGVHFSKRSQFAERSLEPAPVVEVVDGGRDEVRARRLCAIDATDVQNPLGLVERQASQQDAFDDAEHDGREADAQREREGSERGGARALCHHPRAESEIVEQAVHRASPYLLRAMRPQVNGGVP